MQVTNFEEHEDGSATITVDMTEEERDALIGHAMRIAIMEGLKLSEEKRVNDLKELNEGSENKG